MSNAEKYLLLARRGQILRRPVYLNIPIVEHCNLNCRGCFHFSPIAEPWCMEPEDLRQDLALLRDVPEVETFLRGLMIYGGEPLLHPALEEIMDLVRGAFPGQGVNCAIMTNGLLLSRMPESFWEKCRTLAVGISLSPYPIGLDYDALRREIEARGVTASLNITSDGDRFTRAVLDPTGSRDRELMHLKCPAIGGSNCFQLRDGRIYPCHRIACAHILNRRFGTDFRIGPGDWLELREIRGAEDVYRLRMEPFPFCRYCDVDSYSEVEWGVSEGKPEEWMNI